MEKYEHLGIVGEGSYGVVIKCRNKENGRIVAIKKFLEGDDDKTVKKIAVREIRLLKQLRHENLVSLLEVCRKKGRWFLVFEFMDHTVLDDLEQFPNGLEYTRVRSYLFQILRGLAFCHSHNIIHRDIKLENILVSRCGLLKLCDFGFARTLAPPGVAYTEYVATRWYRAPELLVGDSMYGKSVDIWAVGCLVTEMLTGEPLFPGDSDIDQLYLIIKCFGNLTPRLQELFYKNPLFAGLHLPVTKAIKLLQDRYPQVPLLVIDWVKKCLQIDPDKRSSCTELLEHDYFTKDGFSDRFSQDFGVQTPRDWKDNLPLPKRSKTSKKVMEEVPENQKKFVANSKVEDAEPSRRERKPDGKPSRTRASQGDGEKVATLEKARDSHAENFGDSGPPWALGTSKLLSQGLVREQNSSCGGPKSSAAIVIPPISQGPPTALWGTGSPWTGISAQHNFWSKRKMKTHKNPLRNLNQPPLARPAVRHLNSQLPHEKADCSTMERVGVSGGKKWAALNSARDDVRLPELGSRGHVADPTATEARHSKGRREHRKNSESMIPSLLTVELNHPPNLTSQVDSTGYGQASYSSMEEGSEVTFPRMRPLL